MINEVIKNLPIGTTYELPNGRFITRTSKGYLGSMENGEVVKFDKSGEQVLEYIDMENHGESANTTSTSKWFTVTALVLFTIVAFVATK